MSVIEHPFSVTDVNAFIKNMFDEEQALQSLAVRGEISNFKQSSNQHMYFTLKDQHSELRMVMFAGANRSLKFVPKNGMQVIASGGISVYEKAGVYQMIVTHLQQAGMGDLFLQFEQLKSKLHAEGLFDDVHKKPLPRFPRTVGVITSPQAAVLRDIIKTARQRYPQARILLCPAQVQGDDAPPTLIRAIERMNELGQADVLIVGRGGGSIEELWAFNDEKVARAIFASNIPIISAVGHETNMTLADLVADRRAATPTAAVMMAVPDMYELQKDNQQAQVRLRQALRQQATRARERLQRLQRTPWLMQPMREVQHSMQTLDHLAQKLRQAYTVRLGGFRERLSLQIAKLDSLSPLKVMQRGYSLVYHQDQSDLVRHVEHVRIGENLTVKLIDGTVQCNVVSKEESKNE